MTLQAGRGHAASGAAAIGLAAGLFALSTSAALAAGPFSNGSFETGIAPGVFTTLAAGDSTSIPAWLVSAGTVDYIGSYWTAADGTRSLDLSGNAPGAVSQTFTTTAGVTYHVTFALSGNPAGPPTVKTLTVDAGGTPTAYSFDTAAATNTLADMKWATMTFTFTASSATTTLTFTSTTAGFFGPALDNVRVAAATPATKADCKHGGWRHLTDGHGHTFTNQGDCVSFVATHGKNLGDGAG
jgi:choice-of-anchor C domain-containing protein